MNLLLSVHLLTYNNEKHIERTLLSILKQETVFKFEIVIGDDYSTDTTESIIIKYKKQYPEIINYQRNRKQLGILKNFKETLDRCHGKYIFDIAGDDLLKHTYSLQKMVDTIQQDDRIGFVDSGYDEFYEKTKKTKTHLNKLMLSCSVEDYKTQLLLGKIIPIGICYNKHYLYKYVDFDKYIKMGITIEDYPILVDLVMNTRFDRIEESLHIYRIHKHSYSHQQNFDSQVFIKNQMLNLVSYFSKKYNLSPKLYINYKNDYYKGMLYLAGFFGKKKFGKK